MDVSVSDAKGQLTELIRRAEDGEDVILTRHGRAVVRLVPVTARPDAAQRRAVMESLRRAAASKASAGPDAARCQDFLYDDLGLPR